MADLSGKVAIVTGGAHGIGRAIVERMAKDGARVVFGDLDVKFGEEVARGTGATFMRCDVSDVGQVGELVNAAQGEGKGRIDVLVNNAAYIADWKDVLGAREEEWDRCYRVTLMGARHFIKGVLPYMLPFGAGSIVNVASVQGLVAARQSPAYTAIKHGLVGLTRNVAYDFGPQGVRCNALCPGPIRTRYSPVEGSELHQRQVGKTMLGRTGMPGEVAAVASFLASEDASYVTGAAIPVDGGWTSI